MIWRAWQTAAFSLPATSPRTFKYTCDRHLRRSAPQRSGDGGPGSTPPPSTLRATSKSACDIGTLLVRAHRFGHTARHTHRTLSIHRSGNGTKTRKGGGLSNRRLPWNRAAKRPRFHCSDRVRAGHTRRNSLTSGRSLAPLCASRVVENSMMGCRARRSHEQGLG